MEFKKVILQDRELLVGENVLFDSFIMAQQGLNYTNQKIEIENNPSHTIVDFVPDEPDEPEA